MDMLRLSGASQNNDLGGYGQIPIIQTIISKM